MPKTTSLKHRLKMRLGYKYLSHSQIIPVFEDELFVKFIGPNDYYRPSGWKKSYGEALSTTLSRAEIDDCLVRTSDRLLTTLHIKLKYHLQPKQMSQAMIHSIVQLKPNGVAYLLKEILRDHLLLAAQLVCGAYCESELVNGSNIPQIQRTIRITLRQQLPPFISLFADTTAVLLLGISSPSAVEAGREAVSRDDIYAEHLQQQRSDIAGYLHEQKLAHHSDYVHVSIGSNGEPEQPYPLSIVNGLQRPYQPTNGRLQNQQKEVVG